MLVIIVGGIPIAMPTVLSVTLALGAFKLAKDGAIVARMSAVEEMAGDHLSFHSYYASCRITAQCLRLARSVCQTFAQMCYHDLCCLQLSFIKAL